MAHARGGHIMTQLKNGHIAVIGGQDHPLSGRSVRPIELFNPQENNWTDFDDGYPRGPLAREFRLNYQQRENKIIIWAIDFIGAGNEILEYDFTTTRWRCSSYKNFDLAILDITKNHQ